MGSLRPPAVAGLFYPDDPVELAALVEDLLAQASGVADGMPKALIVPHAAYIYSGPVAAQAYRRLRDRAGQVRRVVLVGPAHFAWAGGLVLPDADRFETPFGVVPLDADGVAALRDVPQVGVSDAAHRREHALEVQLPFLQAVLGPFTLLPLLTGEATAGDVAAALERVWDGAETLIVASSDLSHYHDHATARRLDVATAAAIERGEGGDLGPEDACGHLAIAGLLAAAGPRGLTIRRLDLRNSGDTAGPKDRVVGYGAWSLEPAGSEGMRADARDPS